MIRFERSVQALQDKQGEAQQWAKEVTGYINSKFPAVNLQVLVERFGQKNLIHWIADFDNLAALDQFQLALGDDNGYWASYFCDNINPIRWVGHNSTSGFTSGVRFSLAGGNRVDISRSLIPHRIRIRAQLDTAVAAT